MIITDEYVFFFGGICSQWVSSKFTIDGITYNCAEQYMMAKKALLFKDKEQLQKIMNTDNPRDQKHYGRQVMDFDPEKWELVCKKHVYDANYAKFTQNQSMLDELISYGDREIVEASPTDKIWGIGLGLDNKNIYDRRLWNGMNWLGEVIMQVKADIESKIL
jgi:ribA/ribD-fused uncharacterized protein